MTQHFQKIIIVFIVITYCFTETKSQDILKEISDTTMTNNTKISIVPFSFYLPALGVAAAMDIAARGLFQEQTTSTLVGLISTNSSRYLYWDAENYQIPFARRIFMSPNLNIAHYGSLELYSQSLPHVAFPGQKAGSNNSDIKNYYSIESNKTEAELNFKYLIPFGKGKTTILDTIRLLNGMTMASDINQSMNLFGSGRTFIDFGVFYQNMALTLPSPLGAKKTITSGIKIGLSNENTDFKDNPGKGTSSYIKFWKGIDAFNADVPWQMIEISFSKYISLPKGCMRQQTIATNFWSQNVTSWDQTFKGKPMRPSVFMGPNLGGRYRFRALPEARYNDRAAWLGSAEYRITPYWNPLGGRNWLRRMNIRTDWMQFVAFTEFGRVNNQWNKELLTRNLKYDGGVGIRIFTNQMVLRVDAGLSSEGSAVQMFINQAF